MLSYAKHPAVDGSPNFLRISAYLSKDAGLMQSLHAMLGKAAIAASTGGSRRKRIEAKR